MKIVDHISDNRWLYVRLLPVAFVLFCPAPATDSVALIPILPALLFVTAMAVGLFFWITLGPDDSGRYSLRQLFLYASLLPLSRSTCAIWTYLGVLVLTMSASSLLWSGRAFFQALLIDLAFGIGILSSTILAHARLTRRCKGTRKG